MNQFLEKLFRAAGLLAGRGEHVKRLAVENVESRAAQLKSEAQALLDEGKRQGENLKEKFTEARQQALREARPLSAEARKARGEDDA